MYSDKNLVHILTILEVIEKIFIYVKEIETADDFLWHDNQKNINASVALLIAIGEETKKINDGLKNEYPVIKTGQPSPACVTALHITTVVLIRKLPGNLSRITLMNRDRF